MRFKVIRFQGYQEAISGAMLSKGATDYDFLVNLKENFTDSFSEKASKLADKLAGADGGHNKFLEQIQLWIVIDAPLYWWKQFDTYRIGISKSSESTMFKMWKKGVSQEDFESPVYECTLKALNDDITLYNQTQDMEVFRRIINNLPDGYLQTRLVNVNVKSLRNIYQQRKNHKLKEWKEFCKFLKETCGDYVTAVKGDKEDEKEILKNS